MKPSQEQAFTAGEADAYHARNQSDDLGRQTRLTMVTTLLARYSVLPRRVLQIGCGTGWLLHALRARFDCAAVVGVEPSEAAIAEGRQFLRDVDLRPGVCAALPVAPDETFDLVILWAVLCWVGRDTLLRSLAEVDRVTAPGGLILVADFLPDAPCAVPYHHREGLSTYKLDYGAALVATGLYQEVARLVYHNEGERFVPGVESHERRALQLLVKV